jgi:CrcB protein
MKLFLYVCLTGALGTGARYLVSLWAPRLLGTGFPYGTLIVNVVGCFLIALVAQLAAGQIASPVIRTTLMTGFIGGLTTYSSFNYDATRLLSERNWETGFGYVGVMLATCFAAGLLGIAVARRIDMAG